MRRITIEIHGEAERLLEALCQQSNITAEEFVRDEVAGGLNVFNYARAHSRGLAGPPDRRKREPIGPDLEPGELHRIRALARGSIAAASRRGVDNSAELRALGVSGIYPL